MTSEPRRIYLVRHGVTAWNREMRMQGHTDTPLSLEGEEQARRLAARLCALPFPPKAVYSSDLQRARRTAEILANPLGLSVQTTPHLRETCLGEWEGLTRAEIEARGDIELLRLYLHDSLRHRPPGGERLEDAWERMTKAAAEIRQRHESDPLVIVGHGGSLRTLICEALDAPLHCMRRIWLENASLTIVEEARHADQALSRLVLLNDIGHLQS